MFQGDFRAIAALDAVIASGSFTEGARQLHVTQSAISQRIRQLEAQVGGPVLVRSTPPQLTPAGEALVRHWRRVAALEDSLIDELRSDLLLPRQTLSVGINSDSLATWFFAAIAPAVRRQNLLIQLIVDYEEHTLTLLRTGQVVACVTAKSKPIHGCLAIPLGEMRYRCCATPEFQKLHFPDGVTRDAMLQAPAALFGKGDTIIHRYFERHFRVDSARFPHHIVPSTEGFLQVALAGIAHAMLPDVQAAPYLKRRELVDLTPGKYTGVQLFWHVWDLRTPALAGLTEALERSSRKVLA